MYFMSGCKLRRPILMAAPPCSTFSIARFIHSPDSPDGGPQILRDRNHIHGLDKLSPGDRRGLDVANKITLRTISLLAAAHAVGAEFILENPADRGDRKEPSLFISEQHGPRPNLASTPRVADSRDAMRRLHQHVRTVSLQRRPSEVHDTHVHSRTRPHTPRLGHGTLQSLIACCRRWRYLEH